MALSSAAPAQEPRAGLRLLPPVEDKHRTPEESEAIAWFARAAGWERRLEELRCRDERHPQSR